MSTLIGFLGFLYHYLDLFVRAEPEPFWEKFIEEMTGGYGTGILLLGIIWVARQCVARGLSWYITTGIHLVAIPIYSGLHTSWLWVTRKALFGVLGLGTYDYGIMSIRYLMEFPNDIIDFDAGIDLGAGECGAVRGS